MADLVKIGSRIINLDQLIYASYTRKIGKGDDGDERQVRLIFQKPIKIDLQSGQTAYEAQRRSGSWNLFFEGDYADVVWKQLAEGADEWPTPIDATWPEEDE
jgi:hypothetical protein